MRPHPFDTSGAGRGRVVEPEPIGFAPEPASAGSTPTGDDWGYPVEPAPPVKPKRRWGRWVSRALGAGLVLLMVRRGMLRVRMTHIFCMFRVCMVRIVMNLVLICM